MDYYTEEIDSSAVRIRENRALSTQLTEVTEEVTEDEVRIKQAQANKAQIVKSPTVTKVSQIPRFGITCARANERLPSDLRRVSRAGNSLMNFGYQTFE